MSLSGHRVRNLWVDIRAVAAVEFAIVLPFMLLLFVGGVELANALAISVKVSQTAHTVADLVSRNACVTDSALSTMLGASSAPADGTASPAQQALDHYNQALERLKAGDLKGFGTQFDALREPLEEMNRRSVGH
jgi:Flp pilus assembly protein TadG